MIHHLKFFFIVTKKTLSKLIIFILTIFHVIIHLQKLLLLYMYNSFFEIDYPPFSISGP